MAAWPSVSASCSAARPFWLRSSMLAPACSSSCTQSMLPTPMACIRAVAATASCKSMLALCSSSRRTMARWPIPAANMRAVAPSAPCKSTLTPRFSSSFATRRRPPDAARCSSPRPSSDSRQPRSGGSGRQPRSVLSEQLDDGGVAFGLGRLQRRLTVLAAQLGAGARP
eukprot:scaffold23492_cov65-Phaeocystis_antarctica.AAC.2